MNPRPPTRTIQTKLLTWYRRHQRELPWRGTRDPYAIWVSEIMLQQTQVATVRPYYERFLKTFPTVRHLAEAPLERVLKAWEGMGYYSRARNLHRAARQVVEEFGSDLPRTTEELRSLPGIGRYTAGAIASIAFGLDEPVLDGNVTRVLCRLVRIRQNPKHARTQKRLWTLARELIPSGKASLFNQALMDLGATVCVPREPRCPICPLIRCCQAKAHNEQDRLPAKVKRRPLPHDEVAVGVVWKGGRILIDRRKPEGLLGGLWEFPGGKRRDGESLEDCVVREIREELGIRVSVRAPLTTVRHAYTHFKITLHAFECDYVSGRPKAIGCDAWKWVRVSELDDYAFPKATHKVIAALGQKGRRKRVQK
ncbi:MAG: A/G-specific adenine glycosylase [Phycisphaerae bacterium]|nr:A/G-specific adenine glycosylase [Phycisphaerae bacterium]